MTRSCRRMRRRQRPMILLCPASPVCRRCSRLGQRRCPPLVPRLIALPLPLSPRVLLHLPLPSPVALRLASWCHGAAGNRRWAAAAEAPRRWHPIDRTRWAAEPIMVARAPRGVQRIPVAQLLPGAQRLWCRRFLSFPCSSLPQLRHRVSSRAVPTGTEPLRMVRQAQLLMRLVPSGPLSEVREQLGSARRSGASRTVTCCSRTTGIFTTP